MPWEKGQILEFNQYIKSDIMSYIIYADIESLIKKIDGYANNPENSAYFLWIFNVSNLGIWSHRKQTYFISRKWLYEKPLRIFNPFSANVPLKEKPSGCLLPAKYLKNTCVNDYY